MLDRRMSNCDMIHRKDSGRRPAQSRYVNLFSGRNFRWKKTICPNRNLHPRKSALPDRLARFSARCSGWWQSSLSPPSLCGFLLDGCSSGRERKFIVRRGGKADRYDISSISRNRPTAGAAFQSRSIARQICHERLDLFVRHAVGLGMHDIACAQIEPHPLQLVLEIECMLAG